MEEKPLGFAFTTPSALTGNRAIVVVTNTHRASHNDKTGDLAQVWFLSSCANPLKAIKRGRDQDVCGNCPERSGKGGRCYVQVRNAPTNVYRAFRRRRYKTVAPEELGEVPKRVRIGAYGDGATLTKEQWAILLPKLSAHGRPLSYTHQWRTRKDLALFCMASVSSLEERAKAKALGFRTFRISPYDQPLQLAPGEIECLSDSRGISCNKCGLCYGVPTPKHLGVTDIAIKAHGFLRMRAPKQRFKAKKTCVS